MYTIRVIPCLDGINAGKRQMQNAVSGMKQGYNGINSGLSEMQTSRNKLKSTIEKLSIVRDVVPLKFDEAEENYLSLIEEDADNIQQIYQSTLNQGFYGMFIFSTVSSVIGFILLLFYKDNAKKYQKKNIT